MSAHHDDHHHHPHNESQKTKSAFTASFWLVIILAGLFIAALNFIQVMGNDEGHGHAETATHEATHGSASGEKEEIKDHQHSGSAEQAADTSHISQEAKEAHH